MALIKIKPAEIGEAASLTISIVIMLLLVGFLLYASLRPQSKTLAVSSTVGSVVEAGTGSKQFVVPVDVHNHGPRGITSLHLDIAMESQHHMIELQYLAAGAHRKMYVYSPQAAQPAVTITPMSYHVD